jgi:hypothetical protein
MIPSLPKGIKRTGRYYSDNILSQIGALQDVGSHQKMIAHANNAGRMLRNVSRNTWVIIRRKQHLIVRMRYCMLRKSEDFI